MPSQVQMSIGKQEENKRERNEAWVAVTVAFHLDKRILFFFKVSTLSTHHMAYQHHKSRTKHSQKLTPPPDFPQSKQYLPHKACSKGTCFSYLAASTVSPWDTCNSVQPRKTSCFHEDIFIFFFTYLFWICLT